MSSLFGTLGMLRFNLIQDLRINNYINFDGLTFPCYVKRLTDSDAPYASLNMGLAYQVTLPPSIEMIVITQAVKLQAIQVYPKLQLESNTFPFCIDTYIRLVDDCIVINGYALKGRGNSSE